MTASPHPPHDPRGEGADVDPAALLRDLQRAKLVLQRRALEAVLGLPDGERG